MYKPKEMGYCPKCGSNNLYYWETDADCDLITHYAECLDCHQNFKEFEKTVYDGYMYEDDDGPHEFDVEGREV